MDILFTIIARVAKGYPDGGVAKLCSEINEKHNVNMKAKVFNNKCNEFDEKNHLNIKELYMMLDVMKDSGYDRFEEILTELGSSFGYDMNPIDSEVDNIDLDIQTVFTESMDWNKNRGDVYDVLYDSLKDGKISKNEFIELQKEMVKDSNATHRLSEMVKVLSEKKVDLFER